MASIKHGNKGPEVILLQGILARLGHDLKIDGKFGDKTEAAVKTFQREAGLTADGKAGNDTVGALVTALLNHAGEPQGTEIVFTEEEARALEADADGELNYTPA